jgi:hypothetical protein
MVSQSQNPHHDPPGFSELTINQLYAKSPHSFLLTHQATNIRKYIINPGKRGFLPPQFTRKSTTLRKIVKISTTEDVFWSLPDWVLLGTSSTNTDRFASTEDLEMVFIIQSDPNVWPVAVPPEERAVWYTWYGPWSPICTPRALPKKYTIVNIGCLHPERVGLVGEGFSRAQVQERARVLFHEDLDGVDKRILESDSQTPASQASKVRFEKFRGKVEFITMEEYLARGDYEDELRDEEVRPWLELEGKGLQGV